MDAAVARAADALARGGLVVYPTDTLLGFGAAAADRGAVSRLERFKARPAGQPLSVALSSTEEVETWSVVDPAARRWMRRHLPGPYTVLLRPSRRARQRFAPSIVPVGGAIAVRVPDHPIARELARRAGPVVATSANRHGDPPCRTAAQARRVWGDAVAVYLETGPAPSGRPSEFVDLRGATPRLRPRGGP